MDDVCINFRPEDVELLFTVMGQVTCQGKEGATQLLRIINTLESALKVDEE